MRWGGHGQRARRSPLPNHARRSIDGADAATEVNDGMPPTSAGDTQPHRRPASVLCMPPVGHPTLEAGEVVVVEQSDVGLLVDRHLDDVASACVEWKVEKVHLFFPAVRFGADWLRALPAAVLDA